MGAPKAATIGSAAQQVPAVHTVQRGARYCLDRALSCTPHIQSAQGSTTAPQPCPCCELTLKLAAVRRGRHPRPFMHALCTSTGSLAQLTLRGLGTSALQFSRHLLLPQRALVGAHRFSVTATMTVAQQQGAAQQQPTAAAAMQQRRQQMNSAWDGASLPCS